jgi:L-alanine-DL-glutamate epimerase-like enolase superfamily enzyme
MDQLWRRNALDLAGMVSRREVSGVEVIDAHLKRIEAINPHVNAIVRMLADEARAAAVVADRQVTEGIAVGRCTCADHREGKHRHGRTAHHLGCQGTRRRSGPNGCSGGRGHTACAKTTDVEARRSDLTVMEACVRHLKIRVGQPDPMVDLKRVEAARKLLGEFPLAVDANQQWDRPP